MKKAFEGVGKAFIELRFWVATMITALSASAAAGLGLSPSPQAVGLIFFSSLGVYNLDHLVDGEAGWGAWPQRLCALSAVAVVGLLVVARPELRWLVALGLLCISLYFVPFRVGGRTLRLENLPGFKPLLIGGSVAVAAVAVPWLSTAAHGRPRPYSMSTALSVAVILAEICASNALLFDIRDAGIDHAAGVRTAPSVRGVAFTRRLASVGLLAALVQSAFGAFLPLAPTRLYVGTAACALGLLLAAWYLPARASRTVHALVLDGALAVPWLVMVL